MTTLPKPNIIKSNHKQAESEGQNGSVFVGKDILELLSSSMYLDPLTIYREYVQNAADGIDEAVTSGKLDSISEGRIDIVLDHINRVALVRDNGAGLSTNEFVKIMRSIGASNKRGSLARGFRGVGRLAGLGYSQKLIFRSRSQKSEKVCEITWDCRLLKGLLADSSFDGDLATLVKKIITVNKFEGGEYPEHFFEVEIVKPRRIGSDQLLNELQIEQYLSQVGPCPFSPDFSFGKKIKKTLDMSGVAKEYAIYLNGSDEPIYKPYTDKIVYSDIRTGHAERVTEIKIDGVNGGPSAIGWILHHDYQGSIPTILGSKGLRARVGNIQIGNNRLFSKIFPEERFCSWTIGELHIVDQKVIPNGRRDDFENNIHFENIVTHLTPYTSEIARLCRSHSQIRNRKKAFDLAEERVAQNLEVLEQGAVSDVIATGVMQKIALQLTEMEQITEFEPLSNKDRLQLKVKLEETEKWVNKASSKSKLKNPVEHIPSDKQEAYREIFDLIYECSSNNLNAKALVDRILKQLSRR